MKEQAEQQRVPWSDAVKPMKTSGDHHDCGAQMRSATNDDERQRIRDEQH